MLSAIVCALRRSTRPWILRMVFPLCLASLGSAATVNLGVLAYDILIPGTAGLPGVTAFTIANLTHDPTLGGYALPPDFPVLSSLQFKQAALKLVSPTSEILVNLGDISPGFFSNLDLEFPEEVSFIAAEFTAILSPVIFQLDNSSIMVAKSVVVSANLTPQAGQALQAGSDYRLIEIQTSPKDGHVPEPSTMEMLALATVAVAAGLHRQRSR